jgi:hypothetical protein
MTVNRDCQPEMQIDEEGLSGHEKRIGGSIELELFPKARAYIRQ